MIVIRRSFVLGLGSLGKDNRDKVPSGATTADQCLGGSKEEEAAGEGSLLTMRM